MQTFQADKERAARQREFLAQLERESEEAGAGGGDYESSEPTSMTNSSTVEGEHTIQGQYDEVSSNSVNLFGEISPLWEKIVSVAIFVGLFKRWSNFEPTLANYREWSNIEPSGQIEFKLNNLPMPNSIFTTASSWFATGITATF